MLNLQRWIGGVRVDLWGSKHILKGEYFVGCEVPWYHHEFKPSYMHKAHNSHLLCPSISNSWSIYGPWSCHDIKFFYECWHAKNVINCYIPSLMIIFVLKVAVNNIVKSTSILVDQVKEHLKQKVISHMNENAENFTTESVEQIFDNFEDSLINIETSYMQTSVIQNNPNFVQPLQYVLATRAAFRAACLPPGCLPPGLHTRIRA